MVHPSVKPKPAPKTRPARTRVKKIVSTPAVPASSGRSAAPKAESTPSMAIALASMPPSAIWARTTAKISTRRAANMSGAVVVSEKTPGATTNGQKNAMKPTNDAITMVHLDRGPIRMARAPRLIGRPPPRRP